MQFKLDGANLGFSVLGPPYNSAWDTTTVTNGPHTLTAVAFNRENDQTTSGPVTVVVNNTQTQPHNLFVTDSSNGSIYEFTPDGRQSTFATGLSNVWCLAFDQSNNLFAADYGSDNIYKFAPDGTRRIFANVNLIGGNYGHGLALDSAGNLFCDAVSGLLHL